MEGDRFIDVDNTNIEYIVKSDPKKYIGKGKEIRIWPIYGMDPRRPKTHAREINKIMINNITIGGKIIDFQLILT